MFLFLKERDNIFYFKMGNFSGKRQAVYKTKPLDEMRCRIHAMRESKRLSPNPSPVWRKREMPSAIRVIRFYHGGVSQRSALCHPPSSPKARRVCIPIRAMCEGAGRMAILKCLGAYLTRSPSHVFQEKPSSRLL